MGTNDDFSALALARGGITSPLGKFDEELKTHVDDTTANAFRKRANAFRKRASELEQTPSELLRDLIYLQVHGEILVEMCAKHRRALLQQQGPIQGQTRTSL